MALEKPTHHDQKQDLLLSMIDPRNPGGEADRDFTELSSETVTATSLIEFLPGTTVSIPVAIPVMPEEHD